MSNRIGFQHPGGSPVPVELVCVPKEGILTIRWINSPSWLPTHWKGKQSVYCAGDAVCPKALHQHSTVWKGYACVEYWREAPYCDWVAAVFETPERLGELLKGNALRGQIWAVLRAMGTSGRLESTGEKVGEHNPEQMRKPFPMLPVLHRIYRVPHITLTPECPLADRIFLTPVQGQAPPNASPQKAEDEALDRQEAIKLFKASRAKTNGNGHEEKK